MTQKKLSKDQPLPFQTPGEEIANSILHGIGALLAITGIVLLTLKGNGFFGNTKNVWLIVSGAIYGATMFIMFMASTIYHALSAESGKRVFRILDHSAIYLLIAGT